MLVVGGILGLAMVGTGEAQTARMASTSSRVAAPASRSAAPAAPAARVAAPVDGQPLSSAALDMKRSIDPKDSSRHMITIKDDKNTKDFSIPADLKLSPALVGYRDGQMTIFTATGLTGVPEGSVGGVTSGDGAVNYPPPTNMPSGVNYPPPTNMPSGANYPPPTNMPSGANYPPPTN